MRVVGRRRTGRRPSVLSVTDPIIRPYEERDLDELYEICLRTGGAGGDATELVEDGRLFGEIWAAPYALFEPEHAHVVDLADGSADGVVGYVLGTIDARAFEERCEREWWPVLRERHPLRSDGTRFDDLLIALIHHRPEPRKDLADRFPSELHIDILPVVQRRGLGRRLIDVLLGGLADAGSPGVHLGVSVDNTNAVAFYRHVGFDEHDSDGVTRTFTMSL